MKIEPLQDRVLVKRAKGAEMTKSGLYIPETAREKMGEGEVVAVGPGKPRIPALLDVSQVPLDKVADYVFAMKEQFHARPVPLTVAVGDKILFSVHAGTPLNLGGVDYVLLRDEDIYARVHAELTLEMVATGDGRRFGGTGETLSAKLAALPVRPLSATEAARVSIRELDAKTNAIVQEAKDDGAGGFVFSPSGGYVGGVVDYQRGIVESFKFQNAPAAGNFIQVAYAAEDDTPLEVVPPASPDQ